MVTAQLRVEVPTGDVGEARLKIQALDKNAVVALEIGQWSHETRGIVYNIRGTLKGDFFQLVSLAHAASLIEGVGWAESSFR
jgi:hypothetical protein